MSSSNHRLGTEDDPVSSTCSSIDPFLVAPPIRSSFDYPPQPPTTTTTTTSSTTTDEEVSYPIIDSLTDDCHFLETDRLTSTYADDVDEHQHYLRRRSTLGWTTRFDPIIRILSSGRSRHSHKPSHSRGDDAQLPFIVGGRDRSTTLQQQQHHHHRNRCRFIGFVLVFVFGFSGLLFTLRLMFKYGDPIRGQSDETAFSEYTPPRVKELVNYVGYDPKYLVKDGVAWCGFNNRRYMIEATMNLARLSNRIPILPSHMWARTCVANDSTECTKHALEYLPDRRNAAIFREQATWNDDGQAWKLGIEHFIDIPHLRQTYASPLLLSSEFFSLYSKELDPSLSIDPKGFWHPERYTPKGMNSVSVHDTEWFDTDNWVRIDQEIPSPITPKDTSPSNRVVSDLNEENVSKWMNESRKLVWNIRDARQSLSSHGIGLEEMTDDAFVQLMIDKAGLVPTFTFDDSVLMCKALARPSIELIRPSSQSSFDSQLVPYGSPWSRSTSILYFTGQIHDQKKPGAIRFSTFAARQDFTDWVLDGIRPPRPFIVAGSLAIEKMRTMNGQRKWFAAHMRRGDFVDIAWSPEKDYRKHFERVRLALLDGAVVLSEKIGPDGLPFKFDKFYLATDETDPIALDHFRSHGAVLLTDVFDDQELERLIGWRANFLDLRALVEQEILAGSDYFVGSKMSSTTGGAINARKRHGNIDAWSWRFLEE